MISAAVDILSWILLLAGGAFSIVSMVGLVRMPDFYTRMHAASVMDTLGAGLMIAGMILQAGPTLISAKLIVIFVLLLFTGPVVTHALARAAFNRGLKPVLDADRESGPSKP